MLLHPVGNSLELGKRVNVFDRFDRCTAGLGVLVQDVLVINQAIAFYNERHTYGLAGFRRFQGEGLILHLLIDCRVSQISRVILPSLHVHRPRELKERRGFRLGKLGFQ